MSTVHELTLSLAALVTLGAFAPLGCSDDAAATTAASSSTTGEAPNEAPTLENAPAAPLRLEEGRTLQLALSVSDPEGDTVTVSAAPAAGLDAEVDATGTELTVYADYGASGALSVALTLDDGRGGLTTVDVPFDVVPLAWKEPLSWTAEGPEAREHGALIPLPDGRVFLLGGSGYNPNGTPLSDAWIFDPAARTWTAVNPTGDVPPAGASRRVAMAPGASEAFLFGGYEDGFADSGELYRVDLSVDPPSFTLVDQVNPPSPRSLHALAYDAMTDRLFVFGGYGGGLKGDTLVGTRSGDTVTWTDLAPATAPSKRYGFFYGVDAERGRLVLWSGATGVASIKPAKDAWALDLRADVPAWQLIVADQDVAPGRRNGCSVFDPTASRLFVFGGTADAMTTEEGLFVLDARPGKERMVRIDRDNGPDLRSSGFGFFAPAVGDAWMGFGNTATGVYRDFGVLGYPAP